MQDQTLLTIDQLRPEYPSVFYQYLESNALILHEPFVRMYIESVVCPLNVYFDIHLIPTHSVSLAPRYATLILAQEMCAS